MLKANSVIAGMLVAAMLMSPMLSLAQDAPTPARRQRKAAAPSVNERLAAMERAIEAQNQQIQALQQQLQQRERELQSAQSAAQAAQTAAQEAQTRATAAQSAAETQASQQQQATSKIESDLADVQTTLTNTATSTQEDQKKVSELSSLLGRFRFSGDVRVRQEDFFHSTEGCPGTVCSPRVRQRIRLRFGVEGKLSEDFLGGIYIATGSLNDPTSTNETLTNVFQRKSIGFDRGWITFNPRRAKWLSLTGGKFAATWQKTPQTFDNDLNPEGFSEKLSFDTKHTGILKNVSITGTQLMFNESSRGPDSYAIGGQISGKLVMGPWTATPSYMFLNWHRPDVILTEPASVTGSTTIRCNTASPPVCTLPSGIFAPNGMTNSTFVDAAGVTRFTGGFNYSDFIIDNTIKTGLAKFPLRILLEYEKNLSAAQGNNNDSMYGGEISIGQSKDRRDLQFGYSWYRVEQDAVIASFVESDQRAPTNVLQNRVFGTYTVNKYLSTSATLWVGRTLNTALQNASRLSTVPAGEQEPYLKRLQLDVVYKF